jgi:hypothetical protein
MYPHRIIVEARLALALLLKSAIINSKVSPKGCYHASHNNTLNIIGVRAV